MTLLQYLDFDFSEDADGHGSFDAMASAAPAQQRALEDEVSAVLAWAHASFPGGPAPLEEGGEWDCALHGVLESSQALLIDYQLPAQRLRLQPTGAPAAPRLTLSLTLSGTPGFCAALREAFQLA